MYQSINIGGLGPAIVVVRARADVLRAVELAEVQAEQQELEVHVGLQGEQVQEPVQHLGVVRADGVQLKPHLLHELLGQQPVAPR
eukprot:CAMPEP_0197597678 /NCGR_PEP_ID=MMETSP1326-20131121/27804_1 /TAXON_ID=1155430 /ORGANISM="Genus nov. species nov., Strain RCC2288" /LENGTH=84 /DNA_ID=CAMNT_0043164383 /DNA_START=166 /DNA_END=417 /DNA_ORIENTATION=+